MKLQIQEKNTFPTNFNEKRKPVKKIIFLYFTYLFINYHSITDSYQHLLLPDKISSEIKTSITLSNQKNQIKSF